MREAPVPVLMYHSVATAPNDATRALSVAPEAFAEQMAMIGDLGLTPVNTADLAASWRSGRSLPPRPVLITFDDGYEGVHRHALPVLAKHGFASTLFVSTGWIKGAYDTGGGLDTMLDWEQVRELAAADVEIGGHSHTHPQLDQLDDDSLRHELIHCKEILADELGTVPGSFAYPYGYSNRHVRAAVEAAGYRAACGVKNAYSHAGDDQWALSRILVERDLDTAALTRLVTRPVLPVGRRREKPQTVAWRELARTIREDETLTSAVLPAGSGLLVATKRR